MKKFFLVLLVSVALTAAGIGVFIVTFDLNRFKPQITLAVEKAIGSPVKIESLKLGWSGGVVFGLNKLAVYAGRQPMDKSIATLDRANVHLKLGPLLRKKLEVVSVTLVRPRLNIVKDENGLVRVNGIHPPPGAAQAPKAGPPGRASLVQSFSVGALRIENGEIGYLDRTGQGALKRIAVKDLDVTVKNLSFINPVDFEAKFSLLSSSQNMSLKGRLLVPSPQGPYTLQDFELKNDLSSIRISELSDAVPSMKNSGLVEPIRGVLEVSIGRLAVSSGGLGDLNAALALKGGHFQVRSLRSAFEGVTLQADIHKNYLNLRKFSAGFAKGTLEAQALSRNYASAASQTRVGIKADRWELEAILPTPKPGRPQLHGNLSMVFNGDAQGLSWSSISNTLNGRGRVILTNGLVVNLNLLKTVFDRLSKVPGVSDALNNDLPPGYRERLSKSYTVLEPLDFNVDIVNGEFLFPELRISSMGFQMAGTGRASLAGAVDFQAALFLDPELSRILLSSVPNMQYVANSQGLVAIPVRVTGTVQNLSVEPDMDFILQKVLFEKGQELVGKVLEKALNKTGETTHKNILGKLLQ